MTPTDIETAARNKYNAIGDTFWSQSEILDLMYEGCLELCAEVDLIERTYTTVSVANQDEYDFPTGTEAVWLVKYNNKKVNKISKNEYDSLVNGTPTNFTSGYPTLWTEWNRTVVFYPTPTTAGDTIKLYSYNEPQPIDINSTLEIPSILHMSLTNKIVAEMLAKDENFGGAAYYQGLWEKTKERAKRLKSRRRRAQGFAVTINEDILPINTIGGT